MSEHSRRTFLKASGVVIGGLATGTTVTAATSTERFIVTNGSGSVPSGVEVLHRLDPIDALVVRGSEQAVEQMGGRYAPDIEYEFEQPVASHEHDGAGDEPLYPLQWDKQDLRVPEAHDVTRGEGTRVAVIDSGVAAGHPDLQHAVNIDLSRNFTDDGYGVGAPYGGYHGTHIAGIITANDRNETGVTGTAPATEIVDCRVFSQNDTASFGTVVAAMVYSAEISCDAANLSLGAYPIPRNNPGSGNDGDRSFGQLYGKLLNRATSYARRQGTLLVVAAGNDGADLQHDGQSISLPNEAANVMSISATGPIGFQWGESGVESPAETPAYYTNYGTNALDLGAPGGNTDQDVVALPPDERPTGWFHDLVLNCTATPIYDDKTYLGADHSYGWAAGTSMAAPQVAGAAALVTSEHPSDNPNQIKSRLKRAGAVPEEFDKTRYGAGYLDLLDALTE